MPTSTKKDFLRNATRTQRQLAKRFRVSLSFVQDLLKRYREDGTVEPRPHDGGSSAKLNPEQVQLVISLVAADNDATLVELREQLWQDTEVQVSRATVGRIVQVLKLSRKKTLRASERDSQRVQQLRVEYWQQMGAVSWKDLVFVDETGSNLAMSRRYARSLIDVPMEVVQTNAAAISP